MNYVIYKDLQALESAKNFQTAAAIRHSSQSNLSHRLKHEEQLYGILFYDRKTKKLSDAGKEYMEYGRKMEQHILSMRKSLYPDAFTMLFDISNAQEMMQEAEKIQSELIGINELYNDKSFTYILKIVEVKSLSRAASELFISQPALTQYLNNLEKRLQFQIFHRKKGNFELTGKGHVYYEYASICKQLEHEFSVHMENRLRKSAKKITIALNRQTGSLFIARVLPKFLKEFPDVTVNIIESDADLTKELLLTGKADLGYMDTINLQGGQLEYTLLYETEMVMLMPESYKEKYSSHVQLEDLELEKFIMYQPFTFTQHYIEKILETCKFIPNVVCRINLFPAVYTLVASGVGIAFMPKIMLPEKHPRVHVCTLNPREQYYIVCAIHNQTYVAPHILRMIEIMKAESKNNIYFMEEPILE